MKDSCRFEFSILKLSYIIKLEVINRIADDLHNKLQEIKKSKGINILKKFILIWHSSIKKDKKRFKKTFISYKLRRNAK